MKLIISHSDPDFRKTLRTELAKGGHVVVHEITSLTQSLSAIARHSPHAVLAEEIDVDARERFESAMAHIQIETPFVWLLSVPLLYEDADWLAHRLAGVAAWHASRPFRRYSAESRNVLHDERYLRYAGETKQNLPAADESAEKVLPEEMAVFARQVERAVIHHPGAVRYLGQALLTDHGLRREVAYRAVHSSYKVYWNREHLCRWVSLLGFYIQGVDTQYLTSPATPSSKIDYIHYAPPPESLYAVTALLGHGLKPSWMPLLRALLSKKFEGQSEAALQEDAVVLAGWSAILREIAISQVRVMGTALDARVPWYSGGLPQRSLHRATGIYCDFWNLRHLRENPEILRPVADGIIVDKAKATGSPPTLPPFGFYVQEEASSIPAAAMPPRGDVGP